MPAATSGRMHARSARRGGAPGVENRGLPARGLPMVVVPYPHAGGHQRANARTLGEAGAAIVIEDAAFDGDALLAAASVLDDAARLAAMGAASRSLGRRGGARAGRGVPVAPARRRAPP